MSKPYSCKISLFSLPLVRLVEYIPKFLCILLSFLLSFSTKNSVWVMFCSLTSSYMFSTYCLLIAHDTVWPWPFQKKLNFRHYSISYYTRFKLILFTSSYNTIEQWLTCTEYDSVSHLS